MKIIYVTGNVILSDKKYESKLIQQYNKENPRSKPNINFQLLQKMKNGSTPIAKIM